MTDQDHESGEARDESAKRVLVLRAVKELSADIGGSPPLPPR